MTEALLVFGLAIAQNASFTLVSRARNSASLTYHTTAAVLSNGLWLLMFRQLSYNLNSTGVAVAYLFGTVLGSVGMHWVAMHKIENRSAKLRCVEPKQKKKPLR